MFNLRVFTPLALVAGLVAMVAAPSTADAQQAVAYQNNFDNNDGLVLQPGLWAVDNTPAVPSPSPASGGNNLNFNNGQDYSNANAQGEYARTPTINLTGVNSATLSFWCRYETEDTGTSYDRRYLRIYNATSNAQLTSGNGLQFAQTAAAPLTCPSMSTWHQHTWTTFPTALNQPIYLEFVFATMDGIANNYDGWFIDDLVILADDVAGPDAIDDLNVTNPSLTTADLDWTAPADNDISGMAASYDLRFSTSPITEQNFAGATTVTGEPAPGPAGTPHAVQVTGLNPATTYYFAIRSRDPAGNDSLISNVATIDTQTPTPTGGSANTPLGPPKDRYNACSAGTTAAPMALLMLGTLVAMAAALRVIFKK